MTKEQALEIIKLLSALESWAFSNNNRRLPDYLHEQLCSILDQLSVEMLRDELRDRMGSAIAQQPAAVDRAIDKASAQQPASDEVVFIDGVGAGRSNIESCRDGVQWIEVGDRVYWPLSESDAKRLQSACCGNGSFDGPATHVGEGEQQRDEALLRQALEALEAENERLRDALKEADNELDWLDEEVGTCDHSVGVCVCSYWGMRRKMKAALAKEKDNEQRPLRTHPQGAGLTGRATPRQESPDERCSGSPAQSVSLSGRQDVACPRGAQVANRL